MIKSIVTAQTHAEVLDFVVESNRIEGILREPTPGELMAHAGFFSLQSVSVADLRSFVEAIARATLRDKLGLDVFVGDHVPPSGGSAIETALRELLADIQAYDLTPHQAHVRYELLHPFTDGNGRSGRALWAWQMRREGRDPFALSFLHRFYYDALDAAGRD